MRQDRGLGPSTIGRSAGSGQPQAKTLSRSCTKTASASQMAERRTIPAVPGTPRPQGSLKQGSSIKDKEEDKEIKNSKYSFLASLLEHGFDEKLSREWVEVRKQLKAVNTETAFNSFMRQVQKHGGDKNRILRTCVERSWRGFNANWLEQENDRLLTALKNN